MIGIVNQSTLATSEDVALWARALAHQVHYHVAPRWGAPHLAAVLPVGSLDEMPAWAPFVVLLDDADQADALGYHDETPDGRPYARVFARPALDNGVSVSSVLSHEVCEMVGDLNVNRWAQTADGRLFALELCDPVENDAYTIPVDGRDVEVSDFVYPAYFDATLPASTVVSRGGHRGPFTLAKGGYAIVWNAGGQPSQIFGEDYPEWRKASKAFPAARTAKRGAV